MSIAIDLSGKIAVVTGATGQLGRAMARTLARAGADVAVHYRSNAAFAAQLEEELRAMGRRSLAVQADVTDPASVRAMAATIQDTLGHPDIVVANAVSQIFPWKPVLEEELEDYANQFAVCVTHLVLLAKSFAPHMIDQRWGRIIAINTECAMQTLETQSAYAGAKRAMDGVVRVLARELGPHQITVNQVAPGWTVSERDRQRGTQSQPDYERSVPLRRRGTDDEVAHAVAFLASDLAAFITGTYLPVTGGNVMPAI